MVRSWVDIQYFENAGSVSVESTPDMPWTFRHDGFEEVLTGVRADAGHDVEISYRADDLLDLGDVLQRAGVFCMSVDRMRRDALLA